eukprot:1730856-Pyramimonas_sp.AAC.1
MYDTHQGEDLARKLAGLGCRSTFPFTEYRDRVPLASLRAFSVCVAPIRFCAAGLTPSRPVSYTHLRAHETGAYL